MNYMIITLLWLIINGDYDSYFCHKSCLLSIVYTKTLLSLYCFDACIYVIQILKIKVLLSTSDSLKL